MRKISLSNHNYVFQIVNENFLFTLVALGIVAVSPDLEKQGFLAVVFVNREYSG